MNRMNALREQNAKQLILWCEGRGRHPHGQSGLNTVVPWFETKAIKNDPEYQRQYGAGD